MRIYYHIDELGRDAVVASALKKYFSLKGIKIVYGNRVTTPMLKYSIPFDLLIFPNVDMAYSTLGRKTDFQVPVIILPTESVSGTEDTLHHLKLHLMGTDISKWEGAVNDVALFFLWGETHLNALAEEFPLHKEKFVLIGHPRHDLKCRKPKKANLHRDANSKIKVGLITRFDLINVFDARSNLITVASARTTGNEYWHDEHKNIEDRFFTCVQDLRVFFELIDLIGHTHSISLRIHPRENYNHWEELITRLKLPVELCPRYKPFLHWIEDQDLLIAPPSTSFYDCAVAEKCAISIGNLISSRKDHSPTNSDDFDPIFQYFPMPQSLKELLELISKSPSKLNISRELANQLKLETGYPSSKNSLETMCEVICKKFPLDARMEPKMVVEIILFNFLIGLMSIKFLCVKMIRKNYEQSAIFLLRRRVVRYIDSLTL